MQALAGGSFHFTKSGLPRPTTFGVDCEARSRDRERWLSKLSSPHVTSRPDRLLFRLWQRFSYGPQQSPLSSSKHTRLKHCNCVYDKKCCLCVRECVCVSEKDER